MTTVGLAELKQNARAAWAAGDFPAIARRDLWEIGEQVVARVGIRPGEDVIDVACGTGNAALRAAAAGGRVVGVDLAPELFDAGRALAAEAGVEVEWVEGDAEALPFEEGSFDVVLSTLGCMFAPRHEVAAAEIARVLRPGGRIAIASWTPESSIAELFALIGAHTPPPPDFASSPLLWGSEEHVAGLFARTGIELEFERRSLEGLYEDFDSAEEAISFYEQKFGPLIKARELTEAEGRWEPLREELLGYFERYSSEGRRGEPDAARRPVEYLLVTGRKGGRESKDPRPAA